MTVKKNGLKGKFKSKGTRILKNRPSRLQSMQEFLEQPEKLSVSSEIPHSPDAREHKTTFAQKHISAKVDIPEISQTSTFESTQPDETETEVTARLHVHIRKDLADRLLEAVFHRKRDKSIKKKNATQRVIIEQALEAYFQENPV